MSTEGIRTMILCKDESLAYIMEVLEYLQESTIHELMEFHGTQTYEDLAKELSISNITRK